MAQYHAQAVEDHDEVQEAVESGKRHGRPLPRSTYRPPSLQWPFILAQIMLMAVAIALIAYTYASLPDSDTSARLQARHLPPTATITKLQVRHITSTTTKQPSYPPPRRFIFVRSNDSTTAKPEDVESSTTSSTQSETSSSSSTSTSSSSSVLWSSNSSTTTTTSSHSTTTSSTTDTDFGTIKPSDVKTKQNHGNPPEDTRPKTTTPPAEPEDPDPIVYVVVVTVTVTVTSTRIEPAVTSFYNSTTKTRGLTTRTWTTLSFKPGSMATYNVTKAYNSTTYGVSFTVTTTDWKGDNTTTLSWGSLVAPTTMTVMTSSFEPGGFVKVEVPFVMRAMMNAVVQFSTVTPEKTFLDTGTTVITSTKTPSGQPALRQSNAITKTTTTVVEEETGVTVITGPAETMVVTQPPEATTIVGSSSDPDIMKIVQQSQNPENQGPGVVNNPRPGDPSNPGNQQQPGDPSRPGQQQNPGNPSRPGEQQQGQQGQPNPGNPSQPGEQPRPGNQNPSRPGDPPRPGDAFRPVEQPGLSNPVGQPRPGENQNPVEQPGGQPDPVGQPRPGGDQNPGNGPSFGNWPGQDARPGAQPTNDRAPETFLGVIVDGTTKPFDQPTITAPVTALFQRRAQVPMVMTPAPETTPFVFVSTSVVGGTVATIMQTLQQTIVSDGVTQVVPVSTTIVENVNGTPVTQVVPVVETILKTEGGSTSFQTMTIPVGGFRPVSLVEQVLTVGGTVSTWVTNDAPYMTTTVQDGTTMSIWTASPPRTLTTTFGGTLTTLTRTISAISPTGAGPITMTLTLDANLTHVLAPGDPTTMVLTIDGSLVTTVITPLLTLTNVTAGSPTTTVLTRSGTLITTVITPKVTLTTIKPKSTIVGTTVVTEAAEATGSSKADNLLLEEHEYFLSAAGYFLGAFVPVIIAVALSLPIRVIDLNAKMFHPFHALAHPQGALGPQSLTLQFSGFEGLVAPFTALLGGYPIPFLTSVALLLSSLLAPLAAEAIGLKLHGTCTFTVVNGCAAALGVSRGPAIALVALLILLMAVLGLVLLFLRGYTTGVFADPWSLAGISSLSGCADFKVSSTNSRRTAELLADKTFGLGVYERADGRKMYGIIPAEESAPSLRGESGSITGSESVQETLIGTDAGPEDGASVKQRSCWAGGDSPFFALTLAWRVCLITVLLGLTAFLVHYHVTFERPTAVNYWIARNRFGIKFCLAALGVVISFFWISFFLGVAAILPFQAMANRPQAPELSVLISRPTNEFYGIVVAVKQRHVFLFVVSLMTLLAEFLPILLANTPRNVAQTHTSAIVCARLSIGILVLMLVVLVASFFIKWPYMPTDPRTIAGAMHYVTDSFMLERFQGMSLMGEKERENRVKEWGRRFFYGEGIGRSGRRRMGVDTDALLVGQDTAYRPARENSTRLMFEVREKFDSKVSRRFRRLMKYWPWKRRPAQEVVE